MAMGFPYSSVGKESAFTAGDQGLIPGLGRYPGNGNGNPLQYSCLENPMDRGAWQVTAYGVARIRHDLVTKPLCVAVSKIFKKFCLWFIWLHWVLVSACGI